MKHKQHHAQAPDAAGHVEKLYVIVSVTDDGREQPQGPFEGMCLPDLLTDPNVDTSSLQETANAVGQEVRVIEYTRGKQLRTFKPDGARPNLEAILAGVEAGADGDEDEGPATPPEEPTLPGVGA